MLDGSAVMFLISHNDMAKKTVHIVSFCKVLMADAGIYCEVINAQIAHSPKLFQNIHNHAQKMHIIKGLFSFHHGSCALLCAEGISNLDDCNPCP